MRIPKLALMALVFSAIGAGAALAQETRAQQILRRFEHANQWRDHVMVVAHRAGGMQGGKGLYPENSLAALDAAVAVGAEMVEVDVRRASDGTLIIMHDSWLDRTTTCKGEAVKYTLDRMRVCRLVIEGAGKPSRETIPTLREFLAAAKDRILVNIDNKLALGDLPDMIAVARDLGMTEQVVIKENLWNQARIAEAGKAVAAGGGDFQFMPVVADDAVRNTDFVKSVAQSFAPHAMELINWRNGAAELTNTGGPLFTGQMRAIAVRGDWHIWADTYAIVNKPGGFLAGGRGDELAVLAGMPAESWGFWVDRGATIIQTDEPKAAIDWLAANGWRTPYRDEAGEPAKTASIN